MKYAAQAMGSQVGAGTGDFMNPLPATPTSRRLLVLLLLDSSRAGRRPPSPEQSGGMFGLCFDGPKQ